MATSWFTKLKKRTQTCCGYHKHVNADDKRISAKKIRAIFKRMDTQSV